MSSTPKWGARWPLSIGLFALVLLVGVLGVWSVQARIAGAVVTSGSLQVENNRQVIQHPEGGVVGEILVRDGDPVVAGQTVLLLDDRLLRSEKAIVESQLHETWARMARLQSERDGLTELRVTGPLADVMDMPEPQEMLAGQRRLFIARRLSSAQESSQIDEQIAQLRNQITGTEAQLIAFENQLDLVNEELSDAQELLQKKLVQASRVSALARESASIAGEIGRLSAVASELSGKIAALNIERLRLQTARREEAITTLRDLQFQEVELRERLLSLEERLRRMHVASPVSGRVHDSQVFAVQSVISPAQPIMYVVPSDQPMIVAAQVDAIHVDQVNIGQSVSLRFTSFDQRFTPEILGQVRTISADAFVNETTGHSFYLAELAPNLDELSKLEGQELLPGMPVEAYIKTGDRSPLMFLTKPLLDYFRRAFREE